MKDRYFLLIILATFLAAYYVPPVFIPASKKKRPG